MFKCTNSTIPQEVAIYSRRTRTTTKTKKNSSFLGFYTQGQNVTQGAEFTEKTFTRTCG